MRKLGNPTPLGTTSLVSMILLSCLLDLSCGGQEETAREEPAFRVDGVLDFLRPDSSLAIRIVIEIAESREAQVTGLMGRRSLPARGGMLFINEEPRPQRFWMKNTPLPLDIIFLNGDGSIVNIVKKTRPLSEDYIESSGPALHVLEVRSGFTDRHAIDEDIRVRWRRLSEHEIRELEVSSDA